MYTLSLFFHPFSSKLKSAGLAFPFRDWIEINAFVSLLWIFLGRRLLRSQFIFLSLSLSLTNTQTTTHTLSLSLSRQVLAQSGLFPAVWHFKRRSRESSTLTDLVNRPQNWTGTRTLVLLSLPPSLPLAHTRTQTHKLTYTHFYVCLPLTIYVRVGGTMAWNRVLRMVSTPLKAVLDILHTLEPIYFFV